MSDAYQLLHDSSVRTLDFCCVTCIDIVRVPTASGGLTHEMLQQFVGHLEDYHLDVLFDAEITTHTKINITRNKDDSIHVSCFSVDPSIDMNDTIGPHWKQAVERELALSALDKVSESNLFVLVTFTDLVTSKVARSMRIAKTQAEIIAEELAKLNKP